MVLVKGITLVANYNVQQLLFFLKNSFHKYKHMKNKWQFFCGQNWKAKTILGLCFGAKLTPFIHQMKALLLPLLHKS